jgi:hypothetical protein
MHTSKLIPLALSIGLLLVASGCASPSGLIPIDGPVSTESALENDVETIDPSPISPSEGTVQEVKDPNNFTSVSDFDFPLIDFSDPKKALDRLALNSMEAMYYLGGSERYTEYGGRTISLVYDASKFPGQMVIRTEQKDGSTDPFIDKGPVNSWSATYHAQSLSTEDIVTVKAEEDSLLVDIGGKALYRYYYSEGVLTSLKIQFTGKEEVLDWSIKYGLEDADKELLNAAN